MALELAAVRPVASLTLLSPPALATQHSAVLPGQPAGLLVAGTACTALDAARHDRRIMRAPDEAYPGLYVQQRPQTEPHQPPPPPPADGISCHK
jgi:hypothetical protein